MVLLWGETTGRWKLGRRRGETVALSAPAVSAVQTGRLLAEVTGQDLVTRSLSSTFTMLAEAAGGSSQVLSLASSSGRSASCCLTIGSSIGW